MIKNHFQIILVSIIFLSLCTSSCSIAADTQKTSVAQAKTTEILDVTPSSGPTKATLIQFTIDPVCWIVKPLQKDLNIEGSIVFSDYVNTTFAWDISSFRIKPTETSFGLSISPNGDSIVEQPLDKPILTFISPQKETSFPLPD
jgi:hypothetical protein